MASLCCSPWCSPRISSRAASLPAQLTVRNAEGAEGHQPHCTQLLFLPARAPALWQWRVETTALVPRAQTSLCLEEIGSHFPALQLRTRWGSSASQVPHRASEPFRRERHWLLCQGTSSSTWKRGTGGCLPPRRHTDSWDLFLPVRSEHVSAVSCGTGSTVPAGRPKSPRAWPCWKRRQK